MKCPNCGKWNRASMPHCSDCGAPLNIAEASRVAWKETLRDGDPSRSYLRADEFGEVRNEQEPRDALASEMQELKKRKREGEAIQEKMRLSRQADQSPPGVVVTEEIRRPAGARTGAAPGPSVVKIRRISEESHAEERESEARHRVRFMDENGVFLESRTYDRITPDRSLGEGPGYSVSPSLARKFSSRSQRRRKRLKFLAVLLLIALLGGGGYFAWKTFFSAPVYYASAEEALVTASLMDDLAAHTIMIPGTEGTSIYIRELHASYQVVDGFATVQVADHTWYDNVEGILDESMEVTLTPFIKSSSGRQLPMKPVTYTIYIPLSPITLETPDALRTTVSTTMATIRVVVRPGSRVLVNGSDYSDTVSSETGVMSYNATVQPIGDNVFNFVVRSPYCRDNTLSVVLYREVQEIPLDLAVGTYGTTDRSVMKVTATTLPGAYVEVLSPHTDLDITDLDSTGKFSFNALLESIGDNTIIISSSYPGKKTSEVRHTVYYLPPPSEYTVKAWPLSAEGYSELLENLSVRIAHSQVYVVKGVVQQIISEKPLRVLINSSDDGKSQPVVVENFTNKKLEVGHYYRIFADAASSYSSMPLLNARYVYDK